MVLDWFAWLVFHPTLPNTIEMKGFVCYVFCLGMGWVGGGCKAKLQCLGEV